MSTVHETIAAREAAGAEVLELAGHNMDAGITGEPLSHVEVWRRSSIGGQDGVVMAGTWSHAVEVDGHRSMDAHDPDRWTAARLAACDRAEWARWASDDFGNRRAARAGRGDGRDEPGVCARQWAGAKGAGRSRTKPARQ